jgi:hypothetical protein
MDLRGPRDTVKVVPVDVAECPAALTNEFAAGPELIEATVKDGRLSIKRALPTDDAVTNALPTDAGVTKSKTALRQEKWRAKNLEKHRELERERARLKRATG